MALLTLAVWMVLSVGFRRPKLASVILMVYWGCRLGYFISQTTGA